jgi:hypothetical protein
MAGLEMIDLATCLAASASSNVTPLHCRQIAKRGALITLTSCGMSAWPSNFVGLDRSPFVVVLNLRDEVFYPLL